MAVAVLWLCVMYPLAVGPAAYVAGRGWLADETTQMPFAPLALVLPHTPLWKPFNRYANWFYFLGKNHADDARRG